MSPAFEDLYAVVSAFKTMKKQANKQTQKPSSKQTMSWYLTEKWQFNHKNSSVMEVYLSNSFITMVFCIEK